MTDIYKILENSTSGYTANILDTSIPYNYNGVFSGLYDNRNDYNHSSNKVSFDFDCFVNDLKLDSYYNNANIPNTTVFAEMELFFN